MPSKPIYGVVGLFIGAAVDLLINLLAAGIQHRFILDQFNAEALGILAGLAVLGLLIGYWLGRPLNLSASPINQPVHSEPSETLTITRLRAFLSYSKLKGRGIHISDILLFGSR